MNPVSPKSTVVRTSSPRTATLSFAIPRHAATLSVYPRILPPPPTTKTAFTDFPPLSSFIFDAHSLAIFSITGAVTVLTSEACTFWVRPIISLNVTRPLIFLLASSFIFSAVLKSTR